ncbi:MAG: CDP-glucose 4,6-dehydratase [Methylobacter sp.]|nr:CDP-glucose 4,6-dehydratase [Methylobacter sp.]
MVKPSFWADKVVLLTGHTGFKGGWLSLWLQSMGAKVIGYALAAPTKPSLFDVANVVDGMVSIEADIRDFAALSAAFKKYQPEIVIHMAAQPLVRYSYVNPIETYSTNVMGTVHVLEAARLTNSVRAIVNVTSDKCYENREWAWGYRENEPMGGYDPYSNSKGCAELVASAYRSSYFNADNFTDHGVALASARAGNVIGGGDWAEDRLIPDIMRAIIQGRPVNIRNPHAIRPWQHVLEPLSGYLMLAQKLFENGAVYGEGWNFGPSDEDAKPVSWIVDQLTKTWGENASWVLDDGNNPHEAHYLKLDCSKAKARLDWHPRWHLDETLAAIVDWHTAHQAGENMRDFSLAQIQTYIDGASNVLSSRLDR